MKKYRTGKNQNRRSSALSMVPDLQAVTISVTEDTALGTKTLPIVVTDQYGNEYTTSVDVDVVARTKSSDKDFDWDESVIYFMVTDRFFDGNESNNAANGEQTYGKDIDQDMLGDVQPEEPEEPA